MILKLDPEQVWGQTRFFIVLKQFSLKNLQAWRCTTSLECAGLSLDSSWWTGSPHSLRMSLDPACHCTLSSWWTLVMEGCSSGSLEPPPGWSSPALLSPHTEVLQLTHHLCSPALDLLCFTGVFHGIQNRLFPSAVDCELWNALKLKIPVDTSQSHGKHPFLLSHFASSNLLSHPSRAGGEGGCMGLSCQLGLIHERHTNFELTK